MAFKVSVCVPTFNSEKYIRETLDCILAQTYRDVEIIVSDNCSTDGTVAICGEYSRAGAPIVIHEHNENIGAYGNFSRCIELAQGSYIKFVMSDDMLEPTCIERLVAPFESIPGISLVGCAQKDVAPDGHVVRITSMHDGSAKLAGQTVIKKLLLRMSNEIGAPTSVLMRREDCLGGFDRRYFYFGDMHLYCRLLQDGDFYFIDEPLTTLRLHDETGSSITMKTLLFVADMLRLRDEFRIFMRGHGFADNEWDHLVDERIMSYVDYVMLEDKVTLDEVRVNARRLLSMVGQDFTGELLESLVVLVHYAFRRAHLLNIDARWAWGQVSNLEREIDGMTKTIVWRLAEPLRKVKSGRRKDGDR